jgi:hypothetical protein
MVPVETIVLWAGRALIAWLWAAYRRPIVLGCAILVFSGCGLGMIIGSHAVTGWWQSALLGFGTSLLIVGTVELGILGVIKKLVETGDDKPEKVVRVLSPEEKIVRVLFPEKADTSAEVAAILRELASRLEHSSGMSAPAPAQSSLPGSGAD